MLALLFRRGVTRSPAIVLILLAAAITGCGSSGPSRAAIEGKVTIGSQPLKAGRIVFTPLPPAEGPAACAAIIDGQYRIEAAEGPVVGQNRVAVESALDLGFPIDDDEAFAKHAAGRPLPPSPIPPEFGHNSQLTADVRAGEENRYDVAIPAATHRASRSAF